MIGHVRHMGQKFSNSGDSNHVSFANEKKPEKKLSEEVCAEVDEEMIHQVCHFHN